MFDPFEKRISREIRNALSDHFLDLLTKSNQAEFDLNTEALKKKAPDADHTQYINDRLQSYREICRSCAGAGPFEIARLLWDNRLFFECHEWLEPLWLDADGTAKKAVQGIIRAAGAHVLGDAGRKAGSRSSAQKALAQIRDYRANIPEPFDPDELIRDLEQLINQ